MHWLILVLFTLHCYFPLCIAVSTWFFPRPTEINKGTSYLILPWLGTGILLIGCPFTSKDGVRLSALWQPCAVLAKCPTVYEGYVSKWKWKELDTSPSVAFDIIETSRGSGEISRSHIRDKPQKQHWRGWDFPPFRQHCNNDNINNNTTWGWKHTTRVSMKAALILKSTYRFRSNMFPPRQRLFQGHSRLFQ